MEERDPPDEPLDDAAIDQIMAEFRRIGFGMEELGGLAVEGGARLSDMLDFLRAIPDGAGYDEFVRRTRDGQEPSDAELADMAGPELLDQLRAFLKWEFIGATWRDRARWLRIAADRIERESPPPSFPDPRCNFCEQRPGPGIELLGSETGVSICGKCAQRAHEILSSDPPT